MIELFSSGGVAEIILAVLALEALGFAAWHRRDANQIRTLNFVLAALPGACLVLALRAALTGAGWGWIGLWLAASFPAHLVDLWRRPP